MFLTTVRIRRARRDTLERTLTSKQLVALAGHDLAEVMAHGTVVAIVEPGLPGESAVHWRHPDLGTTQTRLVRLVAAAVDLIADVQGVEAIFAPKAAA